MYRLLRNAGLLTLTALAVTCLACAQPVTGKTSLPTASPSATRPPVSLPAPTVLSLPALSVQQQPGGWLCLPSNPSCSVRHDPWWQEWFDEQTPNPTAIVTFTELGPSVQVQEQLAEAVFWAALTPIGRQLLSEAAAFGVTITVAPAASLGPPNVLAVYRPSDHAVLVSDHFAHISSWLLGDTVVHELTHLHEHRQGTLAGGSVADCVTNEAPARQNEVTFLQTLSSRMGGLPTAGQVQQSLSEADNAVFLTLQSFLTRPDVANYVAQLCTHDAPS